MDDLEKPGASKLGHKDAAWSVKAAPVEEPCPQLEAEASAITPRPHSMESSRLHRNGKKKVVLVISAVILMLALVGGGVWFVLANKTPQNRTDEGIAGHPNESENNDNNEKPANEPEPKDEVVELNVNDELVQKLYHFFEYVSFPDGDRFYFYIDENAMAGKPNRMLMLNLARNNVATEHCRGEYYDQMRVRVSECYSGNEIIKKISDIFGQSLVLDENDVLEKNDILGVKGCGWYYNIENDEFYQKFIGCGGSDPRRVIRKLFAAERDSDHVYLYEFAIYVDTGTVYHIGKNKMAGDMMGGLSDLGLEVDTHGAILLGDFKQYEELLGQDTFKWTFTWNGENYIFEKLERI